MEELARLLEASIPMLVAEEKKDLQIQKNLATAYIAKQKYAKAFELFQSLLQPKIERQGHESADVWKLKLLMANIFSVVDIEMTQRSMPGIYANIDGANPLTLYDECLPDLIEGLGSDHPDVQEGVVKRKMLIILKAMVKLENEFLTAVAKGNFEKSADLLAKGVDVNAVTSDGRTALHMAVHLNRKDLFDLLIKNRIDVPRTSKKGNTALHIAVAKGHFDLVSGIMDHLMGLTIFQRRSDMIDGKTTDEGTTALHVAARTGSLALVKILLENGATYNPSNAKGQTPLDLSRNEEVVELLKNIQTVFTVAKNNIMDVPSTLKKLAQTYEQWIIFKFARDNNDGGGTSRDIMAVMMASKHRKLLSNKISEIEQKLVEDLKKRQRK